MIEGQRLDIGLELAKLMHLHKYFVDVFIAHRLVQTIC
jgi:hypothetical protein